MGNEKKGKKYLKSLDMKLCLQCNGGKCFILKMMINFYSEVFLKLELEDLVLGNKIFDFSFIFFILDIYLK